MNYITAYCRISANSLLINNRKIESNNTSLASNLLEIYKNEVLKYPKFHKMDLLAKAAFIGSELILKENNTFVNYKDDEIALIFSNSESSEHSDSKFENSYKNNNPSPSQFVYTLPNILLGEIAIKNKWFGENIFLVLPTFDVSEIKQQIELMLGNGSKACFCGWVNVSDSKVDVFLFTIEQNQPDGIELTENNLITLYNK
ncbi:MAG: hypothetical protein IZT56_05705 [Bacteroidetes bacterium]|nr:hypothetical protein [Bacteroidota bacterium]